MTTMDTAKRARRGASPTNWGTYALGTYPTFADDPRCACRSHNPDLFFPEKGGGVARAKAICNSCPLKQRCRDWAFDQIWVVGVWGATTTKERDQTRRCRNERRRHGECRHGSNCRRGLR